MKKFALAAALVLCLCSSLLAYSFSAFAFSTGKNSLAINPFLYGFLLDDAKYGGGELCLSYGLTDKLDLFGDFNYFYSAGESTVGWYGMLRYDFGNTNIIALKANNLFVSPQHHFLKEWDKFGIQTNVTAQFSYDYMDQPSFWAVLCPLFKPVPGKMDIFCEVNPSYTMLDGDFIGGWIRPQGFGLDIVPGIGLILGPVTLSISAPIYDVTNAPTVTAGMWALYILSFGK